MAHTVLPELPMLAILLTLLASPYTAIGCYTGIFIFGDAYNDAGNYLIAANPDYIGHLPYGMTYFHRSTGRLSDGRIIPDFLAEAFGLPFPPPYLGIPGGHDIRRGVNFAITGATALDPYFFLERGLEDTWTEFTLRAQIGWFKQLLPSLCSSESECRDVLGRSLFLVGEIGINDFSYPLMEGRNLTEIWTFVPYVVDALSLAINELIDLGARTLMVPGVFPNGCVPAHLTDYQAKGKGWSKDAYDPVTGCLKALNKLCEYYDLQLQEALDRLRHQNPRTTIIYANLYKASMSIFVSPVENGFDKTTLRVCCGGGGPYNYNESAKCGSPGSTVCNDPSRAVYWTRFHFTEAAYKFMAVSILEGPNADPPIAHICPQMQREEDLA